MKKNKWKYRVLIVGLGNHIMGDDGAGVKLIEELKKEKIPDNYNIKLIEVEIAPINFLKEISISKRIIAVDAVKGGEKPGTVYELSLRDFKESGADNLHGFTLYEVIKTAKSMTGFPAETKIYGIEPKIISYSTNLSKPIKKTISSLKKRIITEINDL